jgi:glyoxylase-like metal-dependent hydrolase (beta-lactamase superfamily II)
MSPYQISNLRIINVTENILLVHQIKQPFYFSCCDGLIVLPKEGRNRKSIVLDINIEPYLIQKLNDRYGPVSNYVCTHGHMDHIAHIHEWESLGTEIFAPIPESYYLLDLHNFYKGFGFDEKIDYSDIEEFGRNNKFAKCEKVNDFNPGNTLKFENFGIETILFKGHSKAHVGFFLPEEKILHISCLGFDQPEPNNDGFGPWYGFRECSINQYFKDIDFAEELFVKRAKFLTSSHSYVVKSPDVSPFNYLRKKIEDNQKKVDDALRTLNLSLQREDLIEELLKLDIFFPKRKMKGFLLNIYSLWEYWIIKKHIERSKIIEE